MANREYRVVISGGGTGGHVFPAIAIAKALQKKHPGIELLFVGAQGKMEMEKVPEAGYRIIGLPVAGLQRRLTTKNLSFPFKLLASLLRARRILRKFKPDICIGVGGYASGPVLLMAGRMGIATAIQEQNSFPGLTNRKLARKARRIFTAFDGLEKHFPADKIECLGNPVRPEIEYADFNREEARAKFNIAADRKVLLILGGSLGARSINNVIEHQMDAILGSGITVIWQCGRYYAEGIRERLGEQEHIHLMPFISDMASAYACADVIVARAGALTISELCFAGRPTILVPSPNVTADHQTHNANSLVEHHAAMLIADARAAEDLFPAIQSLMKSDDRRKQLEQAILRLRKQGAADAIATSITEMIAS